MLLYLALASSAQAASGEIAFESRGGIWASRADGSERRLLLAGRELAQPAWSPDGSTLAYSDADRVMVLGPAGPRAATAPRGKVGNGGAAWSPDGSALVLNRYIDDGLRAEIVTHELATGAERVLVVCGRTRD